MKVKIFRVEGVITKPNYVMPFLKDIRALKIEDVIEKIYADFGGQHKIKRVHVRISSIREISPEETEDLLIRALSGK